MANADNARKAVVSAILDTWTRGPSIFPLITDLGVVTRGGDSVDVPSNGASTVNTTETANPSAVTNTADKMTVDRKKFINDEVTQTQMAQLMNGEGNYQTQLARSAGGSLINDMDRDVVSYLITEVAAASVNNHGNLDGGSLTDVDVNDLVAEMREQDGIANTNFGLFWLMSPSAEAKVKDVADLNASDAINVVQAMGLQSILGLPTVGLLNGIPAFLHNAVPGRTDALRQQTVATASNVASNIVTHTVPTGHGFVVGQQVWTSGFTTDVPVTAPATITAVTATTIVHALTAANGANGTGTVYSATAMAMLCYAPWIFFATDGIVPFSELVKRSDAAGWAFQLFHHLGRVAHPGSVKILHTDDGR